MMGKVIVSSVGEQGTFSGGRERSGEVLVPDPVPGLSVVL